MRIRDAEQVVIKAAEEWRIRQSGLEVMFNHPAADLIVAVDALTEARRPGWTTGTTWNDVRTGDRVRLAGHEARVQWADSQDWHVHPASNRWDTIPLEHNRVAVRLDVRPGHVFSFRPDDAVEIAMTAEEIEIADHFGWSNRLHIEEEQ